MVKAPSWTDEEIGFLLDNASMNAPRLAEMMGRSVDAVRLKRRKLEAGWSRTLEPWTEDEDELILATPNLTVAQVAAKLPGRTFKAVAGRREKLAKARGVDFSEKNKVPHRVGNRPLIAKTCPKCGLLRQAMWFNNGETKRWNSYCAPCRNDAAKTFPSSRYEGKRKDRNRGAAALSQARYQELSLPHADRKGEVWTEADFRVLSDPDLTIIEKAIKLGRTYIATATACSRGGFQSQSGIGDPDRDYWVIFNPNDPSFQNQAVA